MRHAKISGRTYKEQPIQETTSNGGQQRIEMGSTASEECETWQKVIPFYQADGKIVFLPVRDMSHSMMLSMLTNNRSP